MCPWPVAVSAGPPCQQPCKGSAVLRLCTGQGSLPTPRGGDVGPAACQHPGRPQRGPPRSQAPAAVGAALLPQMWFSRRHIHTETTGQALAARGKGVWQNAARKRKGSIATCCYTCRFSRVGAARACDAWGGPGDGAPGKWGRAEKDKTSSVTSLRGQGRSGHSSRPGWANALGHSLPSPRLAPCQAPKIPGAQALLWGGHR